jgi:hypothetical protein
VSSADAVAAAYSVTVGGKSYGASVAESGGTYTASVANLPGASASGSSVAAAEANLNAKVSALS